ncbi:Hypp9581, partial [Branchiostoma lanceolatum]
MNTSVIFFIESVTMAAAVRFVTGPGQMVICPDDRNHAIRAEKLAGHLYKCARNYHGPPIVRCAFSACHRMPEDELQWHELSCPYATADYEVPVNATTVFESADACCVCMAQQATHVFLVATNVIAGDILITEPERRVNKSFEEVMEAVPWTDEKARDFSRALLEGPFPFHTSCRATHQSAVNA